MTFPTVFANLAAGNQPAALLDNMFNIAGAAGTIPCTATGTNTVTATPITNFYQPASYANFQTISFVMPATLTGSATIRLGTLPFVKLFMPSSLQAGAGDISIGTFVIAAFNAALDSGNGGFQVFNATTPSVIQPVAGTHKALVVANVGGSPDSVMNVSADEVMLENVAGGTAKVANVNLSISTVSNGANGLDSGTIAANTWYAVYVILNPNTSAVAGLLSLSFTTPTLPSGFTYRARVGSCKTGAASTNLHRTQQNGNRGFYRVTAGSQTTSLPQITTGNQGTVGATPTWTTPAVVNSFIPPTATAIIAGGSLQSGSSTVGVAAIAPTTAYGGNSSTNPAPFWLSAPLSNSQNMVARIMIETSTIAVAALVGTGGVGSYTVTFCYGWEDNLD